MVVVGTGVVAVGRAIGTAGALVGTANVVGGSGSDVAVVVVVAPVAGGVST